MSDDKQTAPPNATPAIAVYRDLMNIALKRGTYDDMKEIDAVRSIEPTIEQGTVDEKVVGTTKSLLDKMFMTGSLRNCEEAGRALQLLNAFVQKLEEDKKATEEAESSKNKKTKKNKKKVTIKEDAEDVEEEGDDDN